MRKIPTVLEVVTAHRESIDVLFNYKLKDKISAISKEDMASLRELTITIHTMLGGVVS